MEAIQLIMMMRLSNSHWRTEEGFGRQGKSSSFRAVTFEGLWDRSRRGSLEESGKIRRGRRVDLREGGSLRLRGLVKKRHR
jgi:hypothetical protein